jgi:pimeloyl-ACP methyl ester carboxylesterase
VPDLPGHGKSDRLESFPLNYYQKCAEIILNLLKEKKFDNVRVLGTSGGAIIAMIMASNDRDRFSRIVANSFPGKKLSNGKLDLVIHEFKRRRSNIFQRYRWKKYHGKGWKKIVDNQIEFLENIKYKDERKVVPKIDKIKSEVLLTGSSKDKLVPRLRPVYRKLHKKYPHFKVQLFYHGSNPNRLPGKSGYRKAIKEFLE